MQNNPCSSDQALFFIMHCRLCLIMTKDSKYSCNTQKYISAFLHEPFHYRDVKLYPFGEKRCYLDFSSKFKTKSSAEIFRVLRRMEVLFFSQLYRDSLDHEDHGLSHARVFQVLCYSVFFAVWLDFYNLFSQFPGAANVII